MHTKLWASKVMGVLISRNSDKMTFGCKPCGHAQKIYKGEGGGFLQVQAVVNSCEFVFAHGLSVHQKYSNYTLTNLLFGLCKSLWIIDLLVIRFSPHPRALAHASTLEVMRTKEHTPTPYLSIVFTLGLEVESIKKFGGFS
jgi:hypothetical protein